MMTNGIERDKGGGNECFEMFTEEEVSEISGLNIGEDYIEVMCGCTSHRYGDAVGRLRVFPSGHLEINCECTPGCDEDKLSPSAFEKHSGRETSRKWKNNVWVIHKGDKVPLSKTVLLKYYHLVYNSTKPHNGRPCHRDEFIRCSRCNKERRFRLRSKEECRIHHDALAKCNWECSDMPFHRVSCEDDEERASRKVQRGCFRLTLCKGCTTCVCFGCEICRFQDCTCQTCIDFTNNT
ncbi:Protein ULTRAPETALA 1 [Zostera marina]|uniref:Protein ULTRAPETALA 1 n=1 Tax=Zostera marina TaxID=29655 RepID=A0A0K9PNW4_ZOSMR|nr:Protein ULTRAPETALA 1 [Zostera marina]